MLMTDPMVLPADLLLIPVKDLPENVRRQVQAEEGDYALTRPHSRTPSRIVDAESAELLKRFRKPATIVEAVIQYSQERQSDPEHMLEEAFPMLQRLARANLLVASDSEEAQRIEPSLAVGAQILDVEILRCVQALEDSELFEVKTADGQTAALKILRKNAGREATRMFDREAAVLTLLNGEASPKLLGSGIDDGRRYLLLQWCPGADCSTLAAELRRLGSAEARERLAGLCVAILDAYALLHAKNIVHSDVHARNVLVDSGEVVKLIDFGLARIAGVENEFRRAPRGGVGYFFEPEYAKAVKAKKQAPASSKFAEQYALGALLYLLLTGHHYLNFSPEKHEMFRQIAEDEPVEFAKRGITSWPELEPVIRRALSKHSSDRYPSVADFAEAMKASLAAAQGSTCASDAGTGSVSYPEAQNMLRKLLARLDPGEPLFAGGLQSSPRVSVTYGAAGVAYGLYRIARAREDGEMLALADLWANRAARDVVREDAFYNSEIEITPQTVGRISPYHTASGVHLVQASIARAMSDLASHQLAIDQYVAAVNGAACESLDVALGHAGTLLGAALLLDSVSGLAYVEAGVLTEFGNRALDSLWEKLNGFGPLRECREISYSGAAHGWAGILYATLNWCRASGASLPPAMDNRLDQLARFGDRYGRRTRWRFTTGKIRHEMGAYMAGWCNGSAGFVFLWTLAHQMLGKAEYAALAEQAAFDTWEAESQIGNLCCGFAGQAYALLNLYTHTGEKAWLRRAQAQAQQAAKSILEMPPGEAYKQLAIRAESLYKGELGVAILAAELERPEMASMPFFEPEV